MNYNFQIYRNSRKFVTSQIVQIYVFLFTLVKKSAYAAISIDLEAIRQIVLRNVSSELKIAISLPSDVIMLIALSV